MHILGLDFGNSYTKATSTVNGNPTKSSIPSIMFNPAREAGTSAIGEEAVHKYFYENHLPDSQLLTHLSQRWFERSLAEEDLVSFLGPILPNNATDKIALAIPHDWFSDDRVDDLASVITKSCEGKPVLIFDACACAAASFRSKHKGLNPSTILVCDFGGKTLTLSLCEFGNQGISVKKHAEIGDLSGTKLDEYLLEIIRDKYTTSMDAFEKARWKFELENARKSPNNYIYDFIDLVSENEFFDRAAISCQDETLTYREARPTTEMFRQKFEEKFYEFLDGDVVDYIWVIGGLIQNGFGKFLFKNITEHSKIIKYSDDPVYEVANGALLLATGAERAMENYSYQVKLHLRRYRNCEWTDEYRVIIPGGVDRDQCAQEATTVRIHTDTRSLRFVISHNGEENEINCSLPQNFPEKEVTVSYRFDRFGKPEIFLGKAGTTAMICRIDTNN